MWKVQVRSPLKLDFFFFNLTICVPVCVYTFCVKIYMSSLIIYCFLTIKHFPLKLPLFQLTVCVKVGLLQTIRPGLAIGVELLMTTSKHHMLLSLITKCIQNQVFCTRNFENIESDRPFISSLNWRHSVVLIGPMYRDGLSYSSFAIKSFIFVLGEPTVSLSVHVKNTGQVFKSNFSTDHFLNKLVLFLILEIVTE